MKHRHFIIAAVLLISILFTTCGHSNPTETTDQTTAPSESTGGTVKTTDPSAPWETSAPTKTTDTAEDTDKGSAKPVKPSDSSGNNNAGQSKPAEEPSKPSEKLSNQEKPSSKPNKPDNKPVVKPTESAVPAPAEPPVKPTQPPVKPTEPKPAEPPQTEPTVYYHDWHIVDEQGHEEVVTPAYDETVTETTYEWHIVCNGCHMDFGNGPDADNDAIIHISDDFDDICQGYHEEEVPVGQHETTVHHDAVTQWIVDIPAHWECSVCGKSANDVTILPSNEGCKKH